MLIEKMEETLTVILPCAGEGSRLDLKTPKELFEIVPGTLLIDFSLDHIRAKGNKIKVAVVIQPWKMEVAEYVSQKLPGITVQTVLFNDAYSEWPGSIYSSSEVFSENNLVLFPDSCLSLRERTRSDISTCFNDRGETLGEMILKALKLYKVVFGYIKCTDPEVLKNLGSLRVEAGEVTEFQDKPFKNLELFNSFWGCCGFRKEYGKALYDFLIGSVRHQSVPLSEQSFHPAGAIDLHSYIDLGTWENIRKFQES